ncbi:MAG: TetR/AcrR family transcriptional regulator [Solirubrobacteraceae bacterium]|nr:TetR/AcrR family transcriptional regulator [Patulibacter sp.]
MSSADATSTTPAPAGRVYGGLSAEERLAQRRERLMEVGLELFASRGFARTGVRELCRAARIGERAFYEAVGSREALLRDVYLQVTDDVVADIAQAIAAAPADLRGRLHAGLAGFFASITDDPRRGRVIYVESLGRGPEIEEARREGLGRFVSLARLAMEAYLPDPAPPTFAVQAAVSAAIIGVGEVAYQLAEGETAFTAAEAAEHMTTGLAGAALAFGLTP